LGEEKSQNLRREKKFSDSKKRFSKSQKKKISESLNKRNFGILEEEKYLGISK
jgi:hypothetical protein